MIKIYGTPYLALARGRSLPDKRWEWALALRIGKHIFTWGN